MTLLDQAIADVLPILAKSRSAILTTHVNPDGDGLGSELALAEWLASRGCTVRILNHSKTPAVYRFLDPGRVIKVYDPDTDLPLIMGADLILVIDTNHPERLRSMQEPVMASPATKIIIDHHLDPQPFARHFVTDTEATSTGEIVYRMVRQAGDVTITPAMATSLYCAIMTDTGSFRYPRVDADTHRIVASLLDAGADPVAVFSRVYEQWSNGRIHLLGETLAGMAMSAQGRIAAVTITRDMLKRTGTEEEDTDNFTVYPMSVVDVQVGILFLELPDGVKISFRSRGEIPINLLARQFGGNGHKNAAGARLFSVTLADIRARVISAAEHFLIPPRTE